MRGALWRPPVQPACNHQVQHKPEVAIDSNRNALADSAQFAGDAALHTSNWRLCGSQQKRAREPHSNKRLPDDARFECSDVHSDIRQFGHVLQLAGCAYAFATSLF
jgi:hypothetical protein